MKCANPPAASPTVPIEKLEPKLPAAGLKSVDPLKPKEAPTFQDVVDDSGTLVFSKNLFTKKHNEQFPRLKKPSDMLVKILPNYTYVQKLSDVATVACNEKWDDAARALLVLLVGKAKLSHADMTALQIDLDIRKCLIGN